jgi:hypothetical protein
VLAALLFLTTLWMRAKPGTVSMRGPSIAGRSLAGKWKAD